MTPCPTFMMGTLAFRAAEGSGGCTVPGRGTPGSMYATTPGRWAPHQDIRSGSQGTHRWLWQRGHGPGHMHLSSSVEGIALAQQWQMQAWPVHCWSQAATPSRQERRTALEACRSAVLLLYGSQACVQHPCLATYLPPVSPGPVLLLRHVCSPVLDAAWGWFRATGRSGQHAHLGQQK